MRAAVQDRYGGPEVVRVEDIPRPSPGPGELLVKVHATTVNRTDCGFRGAKPWIVRFFSGLMRPKRRVLGCEFAGTVEAVGDGVTRFSVGDAVFGFDDRNWGGHAEYLVTAQAGMVARKPDNVSFVQAAAITEGAHYGLFYIRDAGVGPGTRVLLNGATGAIGSASLQLMKAVGAHVTAVCRGQHFELVRSLGADAVIDYQTEDFTSREETFDVVFDSVGKSSLFRCASILEPGGVYTSTELGPKVQNPVLALWCKLLGPVPGQSGKRVLFPIPENRPDDLEYLRAMVEQGKFEPVIERTYSLDTICEAYRYVETGQKVGNVIIEVA